MTRSMSILVTTFALSAATVASAQQPSEARIQELIRAAATRAAAQPAPAQNVQAPSTPDNRPVGSPR